MFRFLPNTAADVTNAKPGVHSSRQSPSKNPPPLAGCPSSLTKRTTASPCPRRRATVWSVSGGTVGRSLIRDPGWGGRRSPCLKDKCWTVGDLNGLEPLLGLPLPQPGDQSPGPQLPLPMGLSEAQRQGAPSSLWVVSHGEF